jgi:hypothetical protein
MPVYQFCMGLCRKREHGKRFDFIKYIIGRSL